MKLKKQCKNCEKEFYTYTSQNCKFCSRECFWKSITKSIPKIRLNEDLAFVLGVLCGDGYLSKSSKSTFEIGLRTIDFEFAKKFSISLEKIFRLAPKIISISPHKTLIRGKIYYCKKQFVVKLLSKNVYNFFCSFGSFKTREWQVPEIILSSNNLKVISFFIRGFADSEASAREYCIEITSKNKKGLDNIGRLLKRIKISRLHFYKDRKNVWKLIFSGKDNLKIFYEKVGFSIDRKQKVLKNSLKYKNKIRNFKTSDYWTAIALRKKGYSYKIISNILKINYDTIRGWCLRGKIPYDVQREFKLQHLQFNGISKKV